MAKMKIFEIARSIQQQDKSIKSGDLVKLLNENDDQSGQMAPNRFFRQKFAAYNIPGLHDVRQRHREAVSRFSGSNGYGVRKIPWQEIRFGGNSQNFFTLYHSSIAFLMLRRFPAAH